MHDLKYLTSYVQKQISLQGTFTKSFITFFRATVK